MITIDTGDTVFHRPTRETWVVAHVVRDKLYWCGWPEGCAELADCLLVNKASSVARMSLLEKMRTSGGIRGRMAREKLEREAAVDVPLPA